MKIKTRWAMWRFALRQAQYDLDKARLRRRFSQLQRDTGRWMESLPAKERLEVAALILKKYEVTGGVS